MEKINQKLTGSKKNTVSRLIIGFWLILAFLPLRDALGQMSIISDEETEQYLAKVIRPIFQTAGIPFNRNKIYIVNDNSLNAFVGDGNNLFIHTGTLLKADNTDQISGVLAHETGHILGGHILRQKIKNQSMQEASLASLVLAGAAAAASGRGDVAVAVMLGSQSSLLSNYMAYRVEEERSADDAAVKLLYKRQTSPQGLLQFMKKIQKHTALNGIEESDYFRTHPVTSERVRFLEQAVKQSPYHQDHSLDNEFQRIKAKLYGFLQEPAQTFKRYPPSDTSIAARYAQAIAYFKQLNFGKALRMIDALSAEEPDNPYFYELKAQIYMEQGNLKAAKEAYGKVLKLRPDAALLQVDWAQAALAVSPSPAELKNIIAVLNRSLQQRPSAMGWLLLSQAYDQNGQTAYAEYAAAEYSLRIGAADIAKRQAENAQRKNPPSALRLKLDDLLRRIKNTYPDLNEIKQPRKRG